MSQPREASRLLAPNTTLRNRYRVESLIAQGGMGAIYQAVDQTFHSTVALKQMLATEPSLVHAFAREARLLNSLRHGALPVVMDFFVDEHGQFLVMQHIAGEDLKQVLDRTGRPFQIADVMRWADQLLDALEYLHDHHPPILHRDIKPHNLKISARGDVILLDFGLAKGAFPETTGATSSVFGYTPHYAPFEQILGRGTEPRSDLYALGATLHHLLTGAKPPDAMERAEAVMNGHPDPLRRASELNPAVPPPVAEVLYAAMALNASYRPPTAAAMRAALREPGQPSLGRHGTIVETPPVPPDTLAPTRPARPSGIASAAKSVALVIALLVATLAAIGWGASSRELARVKRVTSDSQDSLRRELSDAKNAFTRERDTRQKLAASWPVTVSDLKLRNELRDGTPLGDYGTRFPKSKIRFITTRGTIQNNFSGIKDLSGTLYFKYVSPDRTVWRNDSSPSGFTTKRDLTISDTAELNAGWGTQDTAIYDPGPYRVELWWDGKLIGAKEFVVYDDEETAP